MKKQLINNIASSISLLIIGLLLGWLFFSGGSNEHSNKKQADSTTKDEVWTCSMHPQIRQGEQGDCPICGMDLIPLDETGASSPIQFVMTKDAVKLAQIETITIGSGNLENMGNKKEILLTGKVKMDERNTKVQNAHINGRVEKLYVSYTGESVKKGQKIAKIYAPELVAAQKELLEAIKLKAEMPKLYEATREKIRQWKLPEATINEIEQSGKIQREVNIYADMSGIVMKKFVEEGDYIKLGQPMFDLMNLNNIWVLFDVYEKDLKWVSVGQNIEFNLSAMPEKTFKARISFIDPIINPITRVASARVEIRNTNGYIKPDMFAKGILLANTPKTKRNEKTQLIVPKTAIMWTGKRSVLYTKVPDLAVPTFEFREVELGADLGQHYVVESGLEDGEEVVVNGTFRLDAAAQLNNKASMMNRKVLIKGEEDKTPDFKDATPKAFKKQLTQFIDQYIALKDALIVTDFDASKKTLPLLQEKLNAIEMKLLKDGAHLYWMKLNKGFKTHLSNLIQADNIDNQRSEFSYVSELLANAITAFGISEGLYYLQHCPMALDDKGANWLSKEERILNPYFGDKMLSCGLVKQEFQ